MQRTKGHQEDGKVQWRKIGGGTFRLKSSKRIIKPQQLFWARPDEVPEAFRDVIIPVAGLPEEPPLEVTGGAYTLTPDAEAPGKYNIQDAQGKQLNEGPLAKDEADKIMKDLR